MDVLKSWRHDLPASVVVFLVALPLCLGISLASGAPMSGGLIAGVLGGVVVGFLSGSSTSVSGPAAGLAMITLDAIQAIGSYEQFLLCVVLAGLLQIVFGLLKGGIVGQFIPVSVIKGMLASIGLMLIVKQIPHAFGYEKSTAGGGIYFQQDGENIFADIVEALLVFSPGAVLVALLGLGILLLDNHIPALRKSVFAHVPLTLWAVVLCTLCSVYLLPLLGLSLQPNQLVNLPDPAEGSFFVFPDFAGIGRSVVILSAFKIAVVASLESLLSIEATDKLEHSGHVTPANRELFAQGIGNTLSGLCGGLPVTAVIVRSSANINAGGKSKWSAILHGIWLLVAILFLGPVINRLPLAALAIILIMVGYKLTSPKIIMQIYKQSRDQFIPFVSTIIAVLVTDLLIGVSIGMAVALGLSLPKSRRENVGIQLRGNEYEIHLKGVVNFINRYSLRKAFNSIPEGASVTIEGTHATYIDHDIRELLDDFRIAAANRNIQIEIKRTPKAANSYFHAGGGA